MTQSNTSEEYPKQMTLMIHSAEEMEHVTAGTKIWQALGALFLQVQEDGGGEFWVGLDVNPDGSFGVVLSDRHTPRP